MVRRYYSAPEAEAVELRQENGFLNISNGVNYSDQQGGAGGNDNYQDGEEF